MFLKTSVFGGFVACLERGAHFRDLTATVKAFFAILIVFSVNCIKLHQPAVFMNVFS
jgi:hypothetical protein